MSRMWHYCTGEIYLWPALVIHSLGNVAYGKNAEQGPVTYSGNVAGRAIDGNHNPVLGQGHCVYARDNSGQNLAWWQVDLGETYVVISINITNRNLFQGKLSTWV